MDNGPTLEFGRRLAARKRPIWLRYVLVPDLTDDPEDIKKTATFAADLGNVSRVDVLPFHQMGRYKWEKLGLDYKLQSVEPPAEALLERTVTIFRNAGLTAY
jgi:pyruvate formate lyase activating enzyme